MSGELESLSNTGRPGSHAPRGSFSEVGTGSASLEVGSVPLVARQRLTWWFVT